MTDNSLRDCLQMLKENEQILQNALKNAREELKARQGQLTNLESKIRLKEDLIRISQQSVRTENEKYFHTVRKCEEKEAYRVSLVQQLGQVNFDLEETGLKIRKLQLSGANLEKKRQRHVDQVKALEGDPENKPEYRSIGEELEVLRDKKRRLDENEALAKVIASGDALENVEAQKRSIEVAISESWTVVNDMEFELKELEETLANLKIQMREDEMLQQAELERLHQELNEVESEEQKLLKATETEGCNTVNYYVDEMDSDTDLELMLIDEPQESSYNT